jgi:hypothetical protein
MKRAATACAGRVGGRGEGRKRAPHAKASGAVSMTACCRPQDYLLILTPASCATPARVVWAAFSPSMKSLSE